jgi:hypothetical protein
MLAVAGVARQRELRVLAALGVAAQVLEHLRR